MEPSNKEETLGPHLTPEIDFQNLSLTPDRSPWMLRTPSAEGTPGRELNTPRMTPVHNCQDLQMEELMTSMDRNSPLDESIAQELFRRCQEMEAQEKQEKIRGKVEGKERVHLKRRKKRKR